MPSPSPSSSETLHTTTHPRTQMHFLLVWFGLQKRRRKKINETTLIHVRADTRTNTNMPCHHRHTCIHSSPKLPLLHWTNSFGYFINIKRTEKFDFNKNERDKSKQKQMNPPVSLDLSFVIVRAIFMNAHFHVFVSYSFSRYVSFSLCPIVCLSLLQYLNHVVYLECLFGARCSVFELDK